MEIKNSVKNQVSEHYRWAGACWAAEGLSVLLTETAEILNNTWGKKKMSEKLDGQHSSPSTLPPLFPNEESKEEIQ